MTQQSRNSGTAPDNATRDAASQGDGGATDSANTMWGGRFAGGPADIMREINASIGFDIRLYAQDIAASKAHARMLTEQGIISAEDGAALQHGLDEVLKEIEAGKMAIDPALEDIHMHVEARLADLVGASAGRLHTARSRNDQVATDFRMWVRDALDGLDGALKDLLSALLDQAEAHAETIMPGFTHLQAAQPVTLGHHLMAYVEMFMRDRGRVADCRTRMNEMPARRGGARRHLLPDRPGQDGDGARFRGADAQLDRRGLGPGLRARIPLGRLDHRHASLADGRGDRDLVERPVRLS